MGRSDRRQQLTFLNGRPVEAAIVSRALREGYHTALMKGQYPVTFLFLEIDPSAVDVNVHPAKREVRFHDGHAVQGAIITAVSRTLRERMKRPVSGVGLTGSNIDFPRTVEVQEDLIEPAAVYSAPRLDPRPAALFTSLERQRHEQRVAEEGPVGQPTLSIPAPVAVAPEAAEIPVAPSVPEAPAAEKPKASDYRVIGVLGKLYVLLEAKEGLVLMDQHAAHERVLFEEWRRRLEREGVPSQRLLAPLMIDLTPRDFDLVSRHLETLERLGFSAEPFGGNTLKLDALPSFLKRDDPADFLHEVIREIRVASERMSSLRLGEDLIATTVCRAAVKANDTLREPELRRLLEDLLACDMPYCCPHGRPTLIQIGYTELERKFGRRA